MIIISCDKCKARYKMNEALIKGAGARIRCKKCNNLFSVMVVRPGPGSDPAPRPGPKASPKPKNAPIAPPLGRTIVFSNQKGGVSKTTSCLNLGISFSLFKKKVLLIDFDSQANLTMLLGYENTSSFYEIMESGSKDLSGFIMKTKYPNVRLLPSNRNMVLLNKNYFGADKYERLLEERLASVKNQYDYILIDTPPSIGFFTINALTCANLVIIPIQCDFLSAFGVDQIVDFINVLKEKTNSSIKIKILIAIYDEKKSTSRLMYKKLKEFYKDQLLTTTIDVDNKILESQIMRLPVTYYDKRSPSGLQYINLAKEITRLY